MGDGRRVLQACFRGCHMCSLHAGVCKQKYDSRGCLLRCPVWATLSVAFMQDYARVQRSRRRISLIEQLSFLLKASPSPYTARDLVHAALNQGVGIKDAPAWPFSCRMHIMR